MDDEARLGQPAQPGEGLGETARLAFGVVPVRRVMIQADAQHQPRTVPGPQRLQRRRVVAHRLHGIGQHQRAPAARQHRLQHPWQIAVEEGLTAGEADLLHRQAIAVDLRQVPVQLGGAEIGERIVARAAFDVAVPAGDVAERAGIHPKRPQGRQGDMRPGLATGGPLRVAELGRIKRPGGQVVGHGDGILGKCVASQHSGTKS